ncbi:MAG: PEP-utilizing enzyme [Patescibacteria group bacterium]
MKIDIDPKKELFRWGPIDGKLIYPDFFNVAFTKFSKEFVSWPDVLWLMTEEKMTAITDNQALVDNGSKNFEQSVLNDKKFKTNYQRWQNILGNWLKYQKAISANRLKKLSNQELYSVFKKWSDGYLDFWTIGLLPEVANYGGEIILKDKLGKIVPSSDFIKVFERLSAPQRLSFYQKADLDLIRLKKLINNKKVFDQKINEYQKKYFWILNSYHHTQVLSVKYFEQELLKYNKNELRKKVNELEFHSVKVKQEKEALAKNYRLNNEILKIANRLAFCVWWQDLRKFYIFLANHYIDLFLTEFSRRYDIDFESLHYYNYFEILSLAEKNKKLTPAEIAKRRRYLIAHYSQEENKLQYISGALAKKIILEFTKIKINKSLKEFKGLVVSRGKTVLGRARILTSATDFSKMKKGEILVAPMTAPEFIIVIKKAIAIVTDEGGMTSHAAIVSRELGIPCIVGTKIATKVLKDGDLVQVDTIKGWVKKIK